MHVSLTPELESRIQSEVKSGLYNDANEIILEALHIMFAHEDDVYEARLRGQLKVGIDQLERGEGITIEAESALNSLFEEIKA